MARERQRESLERLDQAALLSARVQLKPSASNRERLRIFLELMEGGQMEMEMAEPDGTGEATGPLQ
jgi:hypothetical protein